MDLWKSFAIGHADHRFLNPISEAKMGEMIALMELAAGSRVLDIACGKAELLVRVARHWGCSGVGVDLSPPFVEAARIRVEQAGLHDRIEIVRANGADYDAPADSHDLVSCMGASWIWGGHRGALAALARWTKPGGLVLAGEPFWRTGPSPEHVAASQFERDSLTSHAENVRTGVDLGLHFRHAIVASQDDWDYYEGYQTNAAERYAAENPDDPDLPELLAGIRKQRDLYLQWGRDELGWGVYLFQKPRSA